jgi:outer membrane protein assembly factor BamB
MAMRVRGLLPFLVCGILVGCAGHNPLPDLPKLSGSKPQVAWRRNTGMGSKRLLLNLRVSTDGQSLYTASADGRISAWRPDGRLLWRTKAKEKLVSGPGLGEHMVLVGTLDGDVLALDAGSGRQLWRGVVDSEPLGVPVARVGPVVVHSADGRVSAFDPANGHRLWHYDGEIPELTLRGVSTPALTDDRVIAGLDDGHVVALALGSGEVQWDQRLEQPSGRSVVERLVDIDGDVALSGADAYVAGFQGAAARLSSATGIVFWRHELSAYRGPAVGEAVYVAQEDGTLLSLDPYSGATLWRQTVLQRRRPSAPALIGNQVIVADEEGYLFAFARSDGQLLWYRRLDGDGIAAPPAVIGNRAYVLGRSGRLTAVTLPSSS